MESQPVSQSFGAKERRAAYTWTAASRLLKAVAPYSEGPRMGRWIRGLGALIFPEDVFSTN